MPTRSSSRAVVDRDKATLLGVSIDDVYSAIQAQFGSLTASQYKFSRVWWVIVQSDAKYRQNPGDLTRLYTRSSNGQMVPLSALVTTQWVAGPDLSRTSTAFPPPRSTGTPRRATAPGDAIATMEAVARDVLPPGYGGVVGDRVRRRSPAARR